MCLIIMIKLWIRTNEMEFCGKFFSIRKYGFFSGGEYIAINHDITCTTCIHLDMSIANIDNVRVTNDDDVTKFGMQVCDRD